MRTKNLICQARHCGAAGVCAETRKVFSRHFLFSLFFQHTTERKKCILCAVGRKGGFGRVAGLTWNP